MGKGKNCFRKKDKAYPFGKGMLDEDIEQLTDEQRTAYELGRQFSRIQSRAQNRRSTTTTFSWAAEVGRYKPIDKAEEYKLIQIQRDHPDEHMRDEALKLLIMCNQRMLKDWVADQFFKKYRRDGFTFDEMEGAAQQGFLHAIGKFDINHEKQPKLVTYAKSWVRQYMQRHAQRNAGQIYGGYVSAYDHESVKKLAVTLADISDSEGIDATELRIEEMIDHEKFDWISRNEKGVAVSREAQIERMSLLFQLRDARGRSQSMQAMVGSAGSDDEGSEVGSFIMDETATTEITAGDNVFVDQVRSFLTNRFSEDDYDILVNSSNYHEVLGKGSERKTSTELAAEQGQTVAWVRRRFKELNDEFVDMAPELGLTANA